MADIVFESITWRNFFSFGNVPTTFVLDKPGTSLIIGENLDIGGSSGAGKTTMLAALSYCLFDKVPSGVTKDRLINWTNDKSLMEITTKFKKDKDTYTVYRSRGHGGNVKLYHNDKDITPASVNRGEDSFNNAVEDILGFSYNLFSKIILFNGKADPFLSLAVGGQRAIIEELLRITILSKKANALKSRIKDTEKSIELQKLLITQQEIQNETHRKHLAESIERARRWERERTIELEKIEIDLTKLSDFDFITEEGLHNEIIEVEKLIARFQTDVNLLKTEKSSKLKEKSPLHIELAIITKDFLSNKQKILKINGELKHLRDAKCPYCLQKYIDAQVKITELEVEELSINAIVNDMASKVFSLANEIEAFDKKIKNDVAEIQVKIDVAQSEVFKVSSGAQELRQALTYQTLSSLHQAKSNLGSLGDQLIKLSEAKNPHHEMIETLENEGEVVIDHKTLDDLVRLLEHQHFLLKLLVDKNSFIRKNIISKTIPFLNKRIGYYTESLNLPHIVLFQPDMSCKISQLGRELDHGNLSNGEQLKLNMSLCFAFRDVLTYLHAKINVLFTDEVDAGSISGLDVDALIKLLKHKAWDDGISMFIISHRPEFEDRCDYNIVVRKEKDFSTIIDQPDA